ncbi:aromatic-ring hydroxylase C-terminal domain-containing protein [Streptomyces laurentii]|uniref:aromatic-ring hydroxylase C-terminal domain-containing protein n=1 Tax=Streptomyces laurentii TaxID=39478 RepID=UPI00369EDA24
MFLVIGSPPRTSRLGCAAYPAWTSRSPGCGPRLEARRGDWRPGAPARPHRRPGAPCSRRRVAGRVDTLTAHCPSRPGLGAVLVRPDGFTAWAADTGAQAPMSTVGPAEALEEWFGAPEGAVTPG